MKIKGLQKTSLIDYPDKMSCVVFLGGCNFRCGFCQNSDLVLEPEKQPTIPESEFFEFLDQRKGWLDGVTVTGGEPCLHKELSQLLAGIKERGYMVKLDTNGYNPVALMQIIDQKLVDYIAMDIKTDRKNYSRATGIDIDISKIEQSIELIRNSGIEYEFRSTIVPTFFNREIILNIGKWLEGSEKHILQQFRAEKTLDPKFKDVKPLPKEKIEEFAELLKPFFKKVEVRI